MRDLIFKTIFLSFCSISISFDTSAQVVERTTFSVFSSVTDNDSLLIAGGQIMTGESEDVMIEHGYYPLNHSLLNVLSIDVNPLFSIYPNPFQQSFQISWVYDAHEVITIEIYSVNGALIERIESSDAVIEILAEKWARGMYYVCGLSESGVIFNEKVIKS